jgi:hypothetical protein
VSHGTRSGTSGKMWPCMGERREAPAVLQSTCAPASAGTVRQPTKACMLPNSQPAQRTVHDTASLPTAGLPRAFAIRMDDRRH